MTDFQPSQFQSSCPHGFFCNMRSFPWVYPSRTRQTFSFLARQMWPFRPQAQLTHQSHLLPPKHSYPRHVKSSRFPAFFCFCVLASLLPSAWNVWLPLCPGKLPLDRSMFSLNMMSCVIWTVPYPSTQEHSAFPPPPPTLKLLLSFARVLSLHVILTRDWHIAGLQ